MRSRPCSERISRSLALCVFLVWKETRGLAVSSVKPTWRNGYAQPSTRLHSSCTIYDVSEDGSVVREACETRKWNSKSFNLSLPRDWLEYSEATDRQDAAYSVLRCDCLAQSRSLADRPRWKVWGLSFHLDRLTRSYLTVEPKTNFRELEHARNTSESILMDYLLPDAGQLTLLSTTPKDSSVQTHLDTLMVTIHWSRCDPKGGQLSSVRVRLHARRIGSPLSSLPDPVEAMLATSDTSTIPFQQLPNRYQSNPHAKLSSWCRQRRPLEEIFKLPGVGEVLMVRPFNDMTTNDETKLSVPFQILEGLTTNVFVLYSDGTLRTTRDDQSVLTGYTQQLVLDTAADMGLTVSRDRILEKDVDDWEEVFLTSSVKLIVPVQKIWKRVGRSDSSDSTGRLPCWSARTSRDMFHTATLLHQKLMIDARDGMG